MEKITFKNNTQPYLSAENLNKLQTNVEESINQAKINAETTASNQLQTFDNNLINRTYPIGSIYHTSSANKNPGTSFGGEWELVRTFYGGELIGYGLAQTHQVYGSYVAKDTGIAFSDLKEPKSQEFKSFNNIITFDNGTFKIFPKGIVGMVEVTYTISGLGGAGCTGIWWGHANKNSLPTGVTLYGQAGVNRPLLTGPAANTFGGCSNFYMYSIADNAAEDISFYINPLAIPYNGSFEPCGGGTSSSLMIKAFAKYGTNYMWKRIS